MSTKHSQPRHDAAEIKRALALIVGADQVTELRALDATTAADRRLHVESGYFNNHQQLADAVSTTKQAKGIYFIPNPINPALLARAANRLRAAGKEPTTSDRDITARRWLLIDCDPVRPAGIGSTDQEHNVALERCRQIAEHLRSLGWPEPIVADSGNGGHLLYRIDLPADDGGIVQRCLESLAAKFDDAAVTVDKTVFNPARIWKLYGTLACKGDSTPERPHRMSKIISAPAEVVIVPTVLLEALAAATATPIASDTSTIGTNGQFDLAKWIGDHALDVVGPEPWQGGRRWVFNRCPWNPNHNDKAAFIVQRANGVIGAGCKHNGCHGKGWRDLRDVVEPGWRELKNKPPTMDGGERGPSQATKLVELVAAAELFHDPDGEPFATITVADHHETWPLRSRGFKRWLQRRFYEEHAAAPGAQALADALGVLEGTALFEGDEHRVFIRMAELEGHIYLDLANDMWQAVVIDATGWRVIDHPPVKFRRAKAMLSLPVPTAGGSIDQLRSHVNIEDHDWPLLVAFLLVALRPTGPYWTLALHGEAGSAKSTTAKMLRLLVDPNTAPARCEPKEPRDLAIAANNGWLICYDNLSRLPVWLSDALCRLATGGGFATRTLFENDDETIFNATRPALLTGIEELATRGDLLDRCLLINLPRIPDDRRRPEKVLWGEFDRDRPLILGALLTAVAAAIRNLPTIGNSPLPRMADATLWVMAAEPALGWPADTFVQSYSGNRAGANDLALEASPLARLITEFVGQHHEWIGTAAELQAEIEPLVDERTRKLIQLPKGPRALAGELRRIAPNLRAAGIDVDDLGRTSRGRRWRIRTRQDSCVTTVTCVINRTEMSSQHDDGDDAGAAPVTVGSPVGPQNDECDVGDAKSAAGSGREVITL